MIPSYIILALISMVLIGLYDFVYSRAVRKGISPGTMTFSQACFFFPAVSIWAYLDGSYVWTLWTLLGPVAALLLFSGIWAFMRSVKLGEASVSVPIYRINFVVTAFIAVIFLGEVITLRKVLGLSMAVASIVILARAGQDKQPHFGRGKSILWALIAMSAMGLLSIVYKLAVSGGVAPPMVLHSQAVFFITIAFLYAHIGEGGLRCSRSSWGYAFMAAICLVFGLMSLVAALKGGDASVVTPIGQLSFVVSTFMATLWLGERFTKRKIVGLLLAVATVAAFLSG
jgi:transporter family protein